MYKKKRLGKFEQARNFHDCDKGLLYAIGGLIIFGILALSSASITVSYENYNGSAYSILNKQLLFLAIGLIFAFISYKINYKKLEKYTGFFLFSSIVLLTLVFIPGLRGGYGSANSWIRIFGFSVQPSEFVKVFYIIYLAAFFKIKKRDINDKNKVLIPFITTISIIAVLLLKQPDTGTFAIILTVAMIIYFIAGMKKMYIVVFILFITIGGYFFVSHNEYQQKRFKCVLNPNFDIQNTCYQFNQSMIGIGSGGILGRGVGESRQKHSYIPEAPSDSIFVVIAEEIGFIFSSMLMVLYAFIFYRGFKIAKQAPDDFGKFLAVGITSWFMIQTFLNIGGIIGIIPMTGVPLPLISKGGSSVISILIAFGVLLNISRQTKELT